MDLAAWLDRISGFLPLVPFIAKGWQWLVNLVRYRGLSEKERKIASAFDTFSSAYLRYPPQAISGLEVIERPEIEQIQQCWKSSANSVLLHGQAGSGKTGIALRLARTLRNDNVPVLLIRAGDFPADQDPVETIERRMTLGGRPLVESIAEIGKKLSCAVIVDQLDSVAGTNLGKGLVTFLRAVSAMPKVRTLAISRTFDLRNDPDISSLQFHEVECGQLSGEQAVGYLSKLGVDSPSEALIDLSTNLLNLSLIADIVANADNADRDIVSDVNLWKEYFSTIQHGEGQDVAEYVLQLARQATSLGQRMFPVSFPKPELRKKLLSRGILVEAAGRRYAFRHEQMQDFFCALSLLPERLTFSELPDGLRQNVSRGALAWLHRLYHAEALDVEVRFVDDVLAAGGSLPFYSRVGVLENLRQQSDPSAEVAKAVVKHLSNDNYERFFFQDLNNPAWIVPLYQAGLFFRTPEPIEVNPGSFQIPDWPAGKYLARFAHEYEDIAVAVVEKVHSENWPVQELLADMMLKIAPERSAALVSAVDQWLNGRFSQMLPGKLASLTRYLSENGLAHPATQILDYVVTLVPQPINIESSKYRLPFRFRSDHFWVNEYYKSQCPKLIKQNPFGVAPTFRRELERAIDLTKESHPEDFELCVGHYWRTAIPNRLVEDSEPEALDILVDGLRDSVAEVCIQDIPEGRHLLTALLNSGHVIFKRIAMYTLRTFGGNYPDLVDQALTRTDGLGDPAFSTEYCGLLRDQFRAASVEVQSQVIEAILSGPADLERRVLSAAQINHREVTEEDRGEARDRWVLWHLELIRASLTGQALSELDRLVGIYGKPDITESPPLTVVTMGEGPSPVPVEELSQKSFEELRDLFLTSRPGDSFLNPRKGQAQAFKQIVGQDPGRFAQFASFLEDPAMRLVYAYYYLLGLTEGVKDKGAKLTDDVLGLCEYLTEPKGDSFPQSPTDDEPGLRDVQIEVARLLEQTLRADDPYLTRDQSDRIRGLLIRLAGHPDPESNADIDANFDPFTQSINCVRGLAMHGLLQYSLYLVREAKESTGGEMRDGLIEPEIERVLSERLDLSVEPSLAVHSVYGAYIPFLHYLSPDWLKSHLDEVFPVDEEKSAYWQAAWDGYILGSNVYQDVFSLLMPQYQRGLSALSSRQDSSKPFAGSPDEHLAQHMMSAYLAGLTDFEDKDRLLDLFFENAPDAIRAQGVFWLSQVLEDQKPSTDDALWKKCWSLWLRRLEYAENEDVSENREEISEYLRWLSNCPLGLDSMYPTLDRSIKYLQDGFDIQQLTGFLARECDQYPYEAVSLLRKTIVSARELWWVPEEEDERRILESAMACKNQGAKRIAVEVINYLGEHGDYGWKYLLDDR
jgi:hypothetical protein